MNDSQLDHLLKSCGKSHAPPGFASDVWNRIAGEPDSVGGLSAWKHFLAEVFTRLAHEQLGYADIAHIMGCSPKAVETRIYRARQILKERLKDLG